MEIVKITKEAIVLDDAERKKLIDCLDYCYHRLVVHPECGLKLKVTFVDYMRNFLLSGLEGKPEC